MTGKTVLLGVAGGIAAYKAAQLAGNLVKRGASVHVLMTKNATEFVAPLTFETITGNRVSVDTFDRNFIWNVQHVSLAKRADVFVAAPATANLLAKAACGLADDMLTTTLLACRCPKIYCPAMNTAMLENPATRRNLEALRKEGAVIVEAGEGYLACGDTGRGRLADFAAIEEAVERALHPRNDLKGIRVLVTAGPTREPLDPVRFITNYSSGRMGYALAEAAVQRGARLMLVSGPVSLSAPAGTELVPVTTAAEMFQAVTARHMDSDIIIKAAAVADFTPARTAEQKLKKAEASGVLELVHTRDILKYLGEHKPTGQVLCGFSMETENLVENSSRKLQEKQADMIVANNLGDSGAGFTVETNVVTLITGKGVRPLPCMSKRELADLILDELASMRGAGNHEEP